MTGSYVPEGYDAVIRQEDTDYGEKQVQIYREITAGTNYCCVGEDIREGEQILARGRICVHSIWGFWQVSAFTRCRSVRG